MFWMEAALACGGFFCDSTQTGAPVVQEGEKIAFVIDGGFVETHVQIAYSGPPEDFAWVVPVKGDVEVFVSNPALFERLDLELNPRFQLDTETIGNCGRRRFGGCKADFALADSGGEVEPPEVTVTSEGQVGPYDYQIFTGDSDALIVSYLQGEGFQVDDSMVEAITPYVAEDSHFLAVRLQKNQSAGDVTPLGFRAPGSEGSIPIQLTRVAAVDDMALTVNVFGRHGAKSSNYFDAVLDEAQLDWQNVGANYYDLVARAADEAGGHAFVTDASVYTDAFQGTLWQPNAEFTLSAMRTETDPYRYHELFMELQIPENAVLSYGLSGFMEHTPGQRWTPPHFEGIDLAALTDQLDERVFDGLRRAERLFEQPRVTRLSTTLDAAEMTLDPMFIVHPDVPEVPVDRFADHQQYCPRDTITKEELILDDGRVYREFENQGRTEPVTLRLERWSESGVEVVVDNELVAQEAADRGYKRACGCAGRPLLPGALLSVLAIVAFRRRQSRMEKPKS